MSSGVGAISLPTDAASRRLSKICVCRPYRVSDPGENGRKNRALRRGVLFTKVVVASAARTTQVRRISAIHHACVGFPWIASPYSVPQTVAFQRDERDIQSRD